MRGLTIAHLRFRLARHGWPAAAGFALLFGAAFLQVFAVADTQAQAAQLRAVISQQRQRLAGRPQETQAADVRLAAFRAGLPGIEGTAAAIAAIHRAAAANGVSLVQGEYRLAREAGAPLQRYQITLPAKASYPRLRAWLADTLNTVPAAALDEIALRRDDAGSAAVEARVRLTLFLRAG
jgi:Tfp pilus assembly protein FimV